uniref:HECT domain-containing protein n=1 Tax=Panagrellus redivivus TaxID=6233 RepID=A0A7E4VFV3_PANRE
MEAQRKPKVKPRSAVNHVPADLGPAPVPPTRRMIQPFTDQEVRQAISTAPPVPIDEEATTAAAEEPPVATEAVQDEEPVYAEVAEPDPIPSPMAAGGTSVIESEANAAEAPVLPKEDLPPPLPPRSVYPSLQVESAEQAPALPPKMAIPQIIEPEPLPKVVYPDIGFATASSNAYRSEGELMSEGQLLEHYHNEQLEFVDDFIDVFVTQELNPRYGLFDLLERYKEVTEKQQHATDTKAETVEKLKGVNNEVWVIEDKVVTETGRCGDDRAASGQATYKVAKFYAAKIVELKEKLDELSQRELDEGLCLEIRARSLALQIQWTIVLINNNFLAEMKAGLGSYPSLLSTSHPSPVRQQLRGALSDLFYFLRFPNLPKRFLIGVHSWITECSAVLFKSCTTDDQMFLLCQLLRVPSPVTPWGPPLIQTFISIPTLDSARAMNSFVALLAAAVQPVRARDQFLARVAKFYEGEDNTWNVISDDGDTDDATLTQITDADLFELFSQFDIKALFAVAIRHFTMISKMNRRQIMLSLIAFTLTVVKILDEGIQTYILFKNVGKILASGIKILVQSLGAYWDLTKPDVLDHTDRRMIQNEINRLVLQSVHYIVTKKQPSLWLFLVDFPFASITENARQRCQLLLRSPKKFSVTDLYAIPDEKVADTLKASEPLASQLASVPDTKDATCMLSALSSVVSQSETDLGYFVDEMIRVCFLEEATREHYCKVGSEAVAVLLERSPKLLSSIINFIDRNLDHLDEYAIDILKLSPLNGCVLSKEDVAGKLAKWLINRPLEHPASRIAKSILTSVNWGATGQLWIPQEVHDAAADAIVKAHIVKCKHRNGLISKSYAKAAKMVLKVPDLEQNFDQFCWNVLLRLKFVSKPISSTETVQNDLTAFFIHIAERCLVSAETFLEHGARYLQDLVNASCFHAATVLLIRLVGIVPNKVPILVQNEIIRDCVDRLLHADESHYAVQLLTGADKFPGPVLQMLQAGITYQLNNPMIRSSKDIAIAWLQLITCKKPIEWNNDKPAIHLLGVIVATAIIKDPEELFGFVDIVTDMYTKQLHIWRESSKGVISWFTTQIPPPLITKALLPVSPWASFLLLRVEPRVHNAFFLALYAGFAKHPTRTLEEHAKKAASKTHINLTPDRLDYFRWLELIAAVDNQHPAFGLILQQLAIVMFQRIKVDKSKTICPGAVYSKCSTTEWLLNQVRDKNIPAAEKDADATSFKSYYHAIAQWLRTDAIYNTNFNNYSTVILDYLLQMITSGDRHLWLDFVDKDAVTSRISTDCRLLVLACHLDNMLPTARGSSGLRFGSMTEFLRSLESAERADAASGFPAIPLHQGLAASDSLTLSDCSTPQYVISKFGTYLQDISQASRAFVDAKERINDLNIKYVELFGGLYTQAQQTLLIQLQCGHMFSAKCQRPSSVNVLVTVSQYSTSVAQQMNDNRSKREEEVANVLNLLDMTAIKSAHLEFICRTLFLYALSTNREPSTHFDRVRHSGQAAFYYLIDAVNSQHLMFPAGAAAYESCLQSLGRAFIALQPEQQFTLMRKVLSGLPLNHILIEHFTPHVVPPDQLYQLYNELSEAAHKPPTAAAALALLRCLDIKTAGESMPANQFSKLQSIICYNLMSATDANPELLRISGDHLVHVMFHHFPTNFMSGFSKLLKGLDTTPISPDIFETIAIQLAVDAKLHEHPQSSSPSKYKFNPNEVLECINIVGESLKESRQRLATRMYSVWAPYINIVCRFAEYFMRVYVEGTFNTASPTSVIELGLRNAFELCCTMFGPLLEPVNDAMIAPWNPADQALAEVVVEKFVKLLAWLPHSTYLPPGAESVETLFWEYFSTRLMALQRAGTTHVYQVYEEKIVSLNWQRFWPTLMSLSQMDNLITEGPPEVGPLITEIVVRVSWDQIIQHQQHQPLDAHKAFHSLLLSILTRTSYRPANYARCRASLERLLGHLLHSAQWSFVKADTIKTLSGFIVVNFKRNVFTNPNDVMKAFFSIWRQACFFSSTPTTSASAQFGDLEIIPKQAAYVRADLGMAATEDWSLSDLQRHFREVITKIDLLVTTSDMAFTPLVGEIPYFLATTLKEKQQAPLVTSLCEWLKDHPQSSIVLMLFATTLTMFEKTKPQVGLKIVNSALRAYFSRRTPSTWSEACQWFAFPARSQEWLGVTPKSDHGIKPRFLVLNAFLIYRMSKLTSPKEESILMEWLLAYLQAIKPKYVVPHKEVSFLLCLEKLQRMIVRQYANNVSPGVANTKLDAFLALVKKLHSDEKGVSFFNMLSKFGRKPAYPIKIQYFSQIIFLYNSQQQTSSTQSPRFVNGTPVQNSKLQAIRDLQKDKQYAEFNGVVMPHVMPFFQQPEHFTLAHVGQLYARVAAVLYPNEKALDHLDA